VRRGSIRPSCTPGASCPVRIDEHQREVCLDLIYDRRRDGYDPLQELLRLFEGVSATTAGEGGPQRLAGGGAPQGRIVEGDRDGLVTDLEEALAARPALGIVNNVLLGG